MHRCLVVMAALVLWLLVKQQSVAGTEPPPGWV